MCFQQYTAYSEKKWNNVFSANTRSETKRFHQQGRVKLCIIGKNVVFAKIRLFRGILNLIYFFLNPVLRPCLILNDAKIIWKTNYKILCMCTYNKRKINIRFSNHYSRTPLVHILLHIAWLCLLYGYRSKFGFWCSIPKPVCPTLKHADKTAFILNAIKFCTVFVRILDSIEKYQWSAIIADLF